MKSTTEKWNVINEQVNSPGPRVYENLDNLLIWTLHARRWPISLIGTICWMRWALSSCIGSQQRPLTGVSVYTWVSKTCQTATSGSEPSTDRWFGVLTDFHMFVWRLLICWIERPRVAEMMLSGWSWRWQDGFISPGWQDGSECWFWFFRSVQSQNKKLVKTRPENECWQNS